MNALTQLNPFNHIFGRIFIGFWLLILLFIGIFGWAIVHFNDDGTTKPISINQKQRITEIAQTLQTIIESSPQRPLEAIIQQTAKQTRSNLVVVNLQDEYIYYSMRNRERTAPLHLLELANSERPQSMILRPYHFLGPGKISYQGQALAVLIGRKSAPGFIKKTIDSYPILLLLVPILISSILCMILAWSLSRPLRELRAAVKAMRQGNMSAHVSVSASLNDEISHLGRDFNRMSDQVSSVLAGQRRLLADISHELRTPLSRLNLVIGIAGQNQDIPENHLKRIEKEAKLIDEMVGQILQLSRLTSDTLPVHKENTQITTLLRPIISDARYEATAQGKSLNVQLASQHSLYIDPKLMTSAIENIIRNGIKYANAEVSISLQQINHAVIITICDDGNGLPEEELESIFDPFSRGQQEHNRSIEGFGLGLAIAYRAIKLHSGDLHVENRGQGGLAFTIRLPMSVETATDEEPS